MRAAISRCPNYSHCLLGYRGEDIEVGDGMAPVCPECGTALVAKTKPRTSLVPSLINWLALAAIAVAMWFAWPYVVQTWNKMTTPPQETAPGSPQP